MADALLSEVAQRFDLIRDADFDLALQTLRSMDVREKIQGKDKQYFGLLLLVKSREHSD